MECTECKSYSMQPKTLDSGEVAHDGVRIRLAGLVVLECSHCNDWQWPDDSLIEMDARADAQKKQHGRQPSVWRKTRPSRNRP